MTRLVQLELVCKTDGVALPEPPNLATTAIAEAILMRVSAKQVPHLHRGVPKHLKLITSSNFWPFMLIPALMLFVLLVIISLFSMLTSIISAVALSVYESVGEVLKFTIAAAHKVDVVGKS